MKEVEVSTHQWQEVPWTAIIDLRTEICRHWRSNHQRGFYLQAGVRPPGLACRFSTCYDRLKAADLRKIRERGISTITVEGVGVIRTPARRPRAAEDGGGWRDGRRGSGKHHPPPVGGVVPMPHIARLATAQSHLRPVGGLLRGVASRCGSITYNAGKSGASGLWPVASLQSRSTTPRPKARVYQLASPSR